MSFDMKTWGNPISLDANNLNRIEQGIKNAHDTLDITNREVSNLQLSQTKIIEDLNALTSNAPSILKTLTQIETLLANNDISTILNNTDAFLLKGAQTLTAEELAQVYKNLKFDSFLKLTNIKVNNKSVVHGSEVNIPLDSSLDIHSDNAISNRAVASALKNINLSGKIPTKLSDLKQDDSYMTVSKAEKDFWNAPAIISESDPTVPDWAKTPNKPQYSYTEIIDAPTVYDDNQYLKNGAGYTTETRSTEIATTVFNTNIATFETTKVTPFNNRISIIEGQLPVLSELLSNHDHDKIYSKLNHTHQDIIDASKTYTDQEITALYNTLIGPGSTEAIDTIQELANAFKTNSDIIKTINDAISTKLTGTKVDASNPDVFIGYNSEENKNSGYQVAFKGNDQANGLCWSKFANMTTEPISPSACTYNGFFYVSSTTSGLSGADANPFLQYHTANSDFRILTTAYSDIWLQQIATDFRSSYVYVRRKENGTWSNWVKLSNLNNKDVGALPDYTLTISHQSAGNPRLVKFASVNYSSRATCFKMAAMTCHDNGVSYQFLTDMLIAVTTAGEVTANIYKFAQSSIGNVDGVARYTGDVFYVNDTTNKIVDFYILCGQWSASQFTPITKVGSTTIDNVTQYSGNATYYSSGTKTWVNGCGTTYARLSDLNNKLALDGSNTMTGKLNLKASGNNEGNIGVNGIRWNLDSLPQSTEPEYVCVIDGFAVGGRQKWSTVLDVYEAMRKVVTPNWHVSQTSSGDLLFTYA